MIDGICELTLQARDPAALARFYREVFGFAPVCDEEGRIWLACGSQARLGIWSPGTKEYGDRGGSHVHFAFSTAPGGLDQLTERLRRRRIAHRGPVVHEGGDRSVYIEDPEGNVVEVWDYFRRDSGRRQGVAALAEDGV